MQVVFTERQRQLLALAERWRKSQREQRKQSEQEQREAKASVSKRLTRSEQEQLASARIAQRKRAQEQQEQEQRAKRSALLCELAAKRVSFQAVCKKAYISKLEYDSAKQKHVKRTIVIRCRTLYISADALNTVRKLFLSTRNKEVRYVLSEAKAPDDTDYRRVASLTHNEALDYLTRLLTKDRAYTAMHELLNCN
jgi:hypothetical protein